MIELNIPGRGSYKLKNMVLDLNGTIALDGRIIDGVEERLQQLAHLLNISIVTADTCGTAQQLELEIDSTIHNIEEGAEDKQKLNLIKQLGRENTIVIGNGYNDISMIKESALSICILGREGAAVEAILSADVLAPDINCALDLLLNPERLVATLRR